MSVANAPATSRSLEEEIRAHEPSMEEILASIRRIIADDDSLPDMRRERKRLRDAEEEEAEEPVSIARAYPAPALVEVIASTAVEEADDEDDDVTSALDVDEESSAPPFADEDGEPALDAPEDAHNRSHSFEAALEEARASLHVDEDDPRRAPFDASRFAVAEPAAWADDHLSDYGAPMVSADAAASIASHFQTLAATMVINDSGLLQKYAQEMLRPMLKQWLDDNLPVIVERLVRTEIERVARGGRR